MTVHPGFWGSWKGWSREPQMPAFGASSDYFVNGAQMRYEKPLGWGQDDSAGNGLRLIVTRNGFDKYKVPQSFHNSTWSNTTRPSAVLDQTDETPF